MPALRRSGQSGARQRSKTDPIGNEDRMHWVGRRCWDVLDDLLAVLMSHALAGARADKLQPSQPKIAS